VPRKYTRSKPQPPEDAYVESCPPELAPLRDLWVAMAERTMSLANDPIRRAEAAHCTDLVEAVYFRECGLKKRKPMAKKEES